MKEKEEIEKDTLKLEMPSKDYNLLEIHCFLALKRLLVMYWNKQVSKEGATKIKQTIFTDYEKRYKEFDFQRSMFQEHINNIKETEWVRTKLRKMLNKKEKITEEKLCEIIGLCMQIITVVFKEEF